MSNRDPCLQCGYSTLSQVQISANTALFIYTLLNKSTGVLQYILYIKFALASSEIYYWDNGVLDINVFNETLFLAVLDFWKIFVAPAMPQIRSNVGTLS